jgi:NDP-sugar pyrophosphorylase family protein
MTLEACIASVAPSQSAPSAPAKKEVDMLNSFKSKAPEKDHNAVAEAIGNTAQPQHSVVEQAAARLEPTTKAGTASCIGSDMSIVGNIECNGPARVFGRIKGEVRASDLLIGDGAQIEGSVIAQDVTVCGHVKGTIRAVRVKLQNGGCLPLAGPWPRPTAGPLDFRLAVMTLQTESSRRSTTTYEKCHPRPGIHRLV